MKRLLCSVFLLFIILGLGAQTAREMDALFEAGAVSYAQAARFILSASGVLADNVSGENAFTAAQSRGWLPETAAAGDAAKLEGVAFLLMKSFDLKGGLFYRLFPNSRYAYRELVYHRIIPGGADSSLALSGEYFFLILGRTMDFAENRGRQNRGGPENE
jgi:hypothetical protein